MYKGIRFRLWSIGIYIYVYVYVYIYYTIYTRKLYNQYISHGRGLPPGATMHSRCSTDCMNRCWPQSYKEGRSVGHVKLHATDCIIDWDHDPKGGCRFLYLIVRSSDRKATGGSAILPLQANHHVRHMCSMIGIHHAACAFEALLLSMYVWGT